MKIVDKINDITLAGLEPGPAAFLHRYLWDKIYATHIAHSNKGLYGSAMVVTPNMIIDEIHTMVGKSLSTPRRVDEVPGLG
jgi:hypothetical protein